MLALPSAARASAPPLETFEIQTYVPSRLWSTMAWIPDAVEPKFGTRRRLTYGGRSWRGIWNPVAVGGPSAAWAFKSGWSGGNGPATAVLSDVPVTAALRRRWTVVAELYRDADVLVVAAGHPACGGLTRAQANAIVRGRLTDWAAVAPGASGPIQVFYPSAAGDGESHFGVVRPSRGTARLPYARGARPATDGGVGAAAGGDPSVAAISTFSRVRGLGGICAVPLDGVAPTEETVRALTYPEAFPVSYVRPRSMGKFGLALYGAMARLFKTPAFKARLAGYGVLTS